MSGFKDHFVGRLHETALLANMLDRVRASRRSELLLLSGPPGIGKSALVDRALSVPQAADCLRAAGKCKLVPDQASAIVQAIRLALDELLVADHQTFAAVRHRVRERLPAGGQFLSSVIPEAEALLEHSGRTADLPPTLVKERLQQDLGTLVRAIADGDRPLILFLDDVQWADALTAGVLTDLCERPASNLLILAAFRDAVTPATLNLERLRTAAAPVTEIELAPISAAATAELLRALLPIDAADLAAVAAAVHARAAGNPLFIEHLLRSMREDAGAVPRAPKGGTGRDGDGVFAFMRYRLARLKPEEKQMLRVLDLLGGQGTIDLVAAALRLPEEDIAAAAPTLMAFGLLKDVPGGIAFAHDQVLEAARLLGDERRRPRQHARLARLMLRRSRQGREPLHVVASQALGAIDGAGAALLRPRDRRRFARLLLQASRRGLTSGLIDQSAAYIDGADRLVSPEWWSLRPRLAAAIRLLRAETLLLRGEVGESEGIVRALVGRDLPLAQRGQAYRLLATIRTMQSDYEGAIAAALEGLALLGQPLQRHPSDAICDAAHERVRALMGPRPDRALAKRPLTRDPVLRATTSLLSTLIVATFSGDSLLFTHVARIVELTITRGSTPHAAYGLAWYGVMIASRYGRYADGFAYCQAALALVEHHGLEDQRTATLLALDQLAPWVQPFSTALDYARAAVHAGRSTGDAAMTCYARNHVVSDLLQMGRPLSEARAEAEEGIKLTRRYGFRDIEILLDSQLRLIEALQSGGDSLPRVSDSDVVSAATAFWRALYRGMEAFLTGDSAAACRFLALAQDTAWSLPAHIDLGYLAFFQALAAADADDPGTALAAMAPAHARLEAWAALNPQTFAHKRLLVEAEMARLRGEGAEALRRFEGAIEASGEFIHERALAHERAALHCSAEGLSVLARMHRAAASRDYRSWGAAAKADALAAQDGASPGEPHPATSAPSSEQVLAAMLALAGAKDPDTILPEILRAMLRQCSASSGMLLLLNDGNPMVEVMGERLGGDVDVRRLRAFPTREVLAEPTLFALLRLARPRYLEEGEALGCPLLADGVRIGVVYLRPDASAEARGPLNLALLGAFANHAAAWLEVALRSARQAAENDRQTRSREALRLARIELARTSQLAMMGGLAASIAHEVNQPLATIIGSADASLRWLRRDVPDIDEAVAGLQGIRAGARRAADIIASLRSLAKRDQASLAPLALDPLVGEVVRMTQTEAEAQGVALACQLDGGEAQVLGDPVQLQQVMLNLITNALDALSEKPEGDRRVWVRTGVVNGALQVIVRDTGAGIPPAVRNQIFMPLYTTKGKGMGMGLAICRSIIEVHGGTLTLDATSGEGTVFRLTLPVR
ncbi:GHKL domain-containing protein [Sphingomonas sp. ABOLD]|uniref:histidine kinase n=1 Tax=Sphingomonas trueperi TaxID=53317 RepID=A0A7X5Y2D4_9SPHN|nr:MULTISPECIES: ATP-binding protein [Sphingomonas]NJB99832.1 signal transduction histidine kinase/predicted ATPase [Sphingomonas trueperi]RSV52413.1 GHKL domain-containing protein [Sphingomonas sp. ABOLD]